MNLKVIYQLIKKIFFILLLFPLIGALDSLSPLPSDQAFMLVSYLSKENEVILDWLIAPQYYLYVKEIHIDFSKQINAKIFLPQGELQYDNVRGRFEAYSGHVINKIVLNEKPHTPINMKVKYQGCSHEGFCYPPMQKTFSINFNSLKIEPINDNEALTSRHSIKQFLNLMDDQYSVKNLLSNKHMLIVFLLFLLFGLFLSFTPCVLPMLPILTAIIVGEKNKKARHLSQTFFLSFSYVLGSASAYAIAGVLAATLGASLQIWLQKPIIIVLLASVIIILALALFDLYTLQVPRWFRNRFNRETSDFSNASMAGVFLMGMVSTLVISPCVTAPLAGVLMYIAQTGDKWLGGIALFSMGLGMGVPLIIAAISADRLLPKTGEWMIVVKHLFGFLMLGMAVWLLSRIMSLFLAKFIWMIFLAIFIFYLLKMFHTKLKQYKWVPYASYSISIILFSSAIFYGLFSSPIELPSSSFTTVKDMNDLNQALMLAKLKHQPVLLDFYADWCDACVVMDKRVFNAHTVRQALSNYKLLRIDVTKNTERDEKLLKHFAVIAPPTVLFFDNEGSELTTKRVVGELNEEEFLNRIIQ